MKTRKGSNESRLGIARRDLIKICAIVLVAVFLGIMSVDSLAQGTANWKYYYITPPLHHDTVTMKEYAEEVRRLTKDQLQITVYPGGELPYRPTEAVNIVRDRFVDGAEAVGDFVAGTVPLLNLTNLPMLITDLKEMEKAMKVFVPYAEKEFERRGIRLLFWHFNAQKCIFGRGEPITSLNDIKGKKIRTFGVPDSQFIRRLGATPVSMPNTEVPTAMQRGVMDAFIASASFSVGSRWDELCDWGYLFDMTAIAVYELVSIPSLKKLSDANAGIIFDLAEKYQTKWHQMKIDLEKKARTAMAKKGKKMINVTPEDRLKATEIIKPYWNEWASSVGPNAVEALQTVRSTLSK